MNEFLYQFGIEWKTLLSQIINFTILLLLLRFFAYKPIVQVLKNRQKRIEEGIAKANEAEVRLKEVDEISKKKLKETDEKAVALLAETDVMKKQLETEITVKAKDKEKELLKRAEESAERSKKEMMQEIQKQAASIISKAIAKGVDSEPEDVDEKLIHKTAAILAKENEL